MLITNIVLVISLYCFFSLNINSYKVSNFLLLKAFLILMTYYVLIYSKFLIIKKL